MAKENATETGAVADLAVKAAAAASILKTDDGRLFLIVPDGMKHHQITRDHAVATLRPNNVVQSVTLQTVDSLVDYVQRFKTADTMLFADIDANRIVAIVDYHVAQQAVATLKEGERQANFLKHAATLTLPFSEEWQVWTKASDGGLMGQLDFARFLEENGGDVVAPDGGTLLEICRDLQAARNVNFTKAVRTASDNENFEYTDKTDLSDKGGIEVPTKFQLRLPVYFGEETTELFAYLRWAIDTERGGLKIGAKLSRAEYVRQAWFKRIVGDVAGRTDCSVVYGKQ